MHVVLDRPDEIGATVRGLAGRLDRSRVAAVGHSLGGMTVAMLAGMRVTDPETEEVGDAREPRIGAFIMFAPPGDSGQLDLIAGTLFPVLKHLDFSTMDRPALVVSATRTRTSGSRCMPTIAPAPIASVPGRRSC